MSKIDEMKLTDIKSDPSDVLGLQYNKYKNSLYSDSLSKPSAYFELKGKLEEALKTELVSNMYKVIYELLRYGQINGKSVCGADAAGKDRIPGVPSAIVNKMSLQITKTFDDFMDEIIAILMPRNYLELAKNKLTEKSNSV